LTGKIRLAGRNDFAVKHVDIGSDRFADIDLAVGFLGTFSARRASSNSISILLLNSEIVCAVSDVALYTAIADSPYTCMPPTRMTPAMPTMPIATIL
jgi:hypothetical protein